MKKNSNIVQEPQTEWGGKWTEKKLDAFGKYVSAYLTIMKKYPYWKTIYFDGFAGSGEKKCKSTSQLYQQLMITEEDEKLYKGAAERVLTLSNNLSFDFHYFIDTKEESLKKLENKLCELQKTKENPFQYRSGDCNKHILDLSKAMKQNKNAFASLVLLDPFGMQIDWKSIETLKDTRSDIWILIPTGVIVNRLLDKHCNLKHSLKLQSFFGLSEEEIKEYFYRKETQATLFGEEESIKKVKKPIQKIADLYASRLGTIWKYVTEKPLCLVNTKDVPIFHFVFASNNESAYKIAKQIIKTV
ncbi:MAG TPA: three-Cys-motif partner protein TcmP [Bacteroidales bacterium]|nr:three-Cys-motif partner protein TcmP [Bacteroidales bacterium]